MVEPVSASIALGAAAIGAAGAVGGGYLSGRNSGKETKIERQKRKLVDELLASLKGDGAFSDLYSADEDVFQKSFVDPAKSIFNNQIAPQIQQNYIASGQQRGTGLDDQLLRAGVDLDQLLNQHLGSFYENAQNRKQSAINAIFGVGAGGTSDQSPKQALNQSLSGYLSSSAFSNSVSNIFDTFGKPGAVTESPSRTGFAKDINETANLPR